MANDHFTKKLRGTQSEEDAAIAVAEDKRLVRLGIDPEANPVEIMKLVDEKLRKLRGMSEDS